MSVSTLTGFVIGCVGLCAVANPCNLYLKDLTQPSNLLVAKRENNNSFRATDPEQPAPPCRSQAVNQWEWAWEVGAAIGEKEVEVVEAEVEEWEVEAGEAG